jgi:hypothetical protein
MSFYVGQQVVCVNIDFSREPTWRAAVKTFPQMNSVYTIRSICEAGDLIGFCFHEFVNPPAHFSRGFAEPAFDSRRFRPVRRTNIEVFEKLLAPIDRKSRRKQEELV